MVWRMLARTKLTAVSDTVTVNPIVADKFIKVIANIVGTGNEEPQWRFNNDSTSGNYTTRRSNDGTEATFTSNQTMSKSNATGGLRNTIKILDIINVAANEKLVNEDDCSSESTGNDAADCRAAESCWKWINTSDQITRIDLINNGSGDFGIGTEVIVFGSEVASTASAAVYPLIPNGAIYEEQDTGKIYMFDGSQTWNELT